MLNTISLLFMPVVITGIIAYGLSQKAPVYNHFIDGTKSGLNTAFSIVPSIIAIFVAIEVFKASGALDFLVGLLNPGLSMIGFPTEVLPFTLMKPISGSGSLVLIEQIASSYGADSYVTRVASVMMGSAETVFYTLAVYFGATHVKNMRHTLKVGMMGYIVGIVASILICLYI